MQLFLRGVDGRIRLLEAAGPESHVNDLKALIEAEMHIPSNELRISHETKEIGCLDNTLAELGIKNESSLQIHLRLLGGNDDEDELSSGSDTESESEEDEDTGLTENQNRLLYMISLYTKKAAAGTDEKDEWVCYLRYFSHATFIIFSKYCSDDLIKHTYIYFLTAYFKPDYFQTGKKTGSDSLTV